MAPVVILADALIAAPHLAFLLGAIILLFMLRPDLLLRPTKKGLYCPPGDFYLDPVGGKVDRAVITHGHADHARAGHTNVLATQATLDIMAARYGAKFAQHVQALNWTETVSINGVKVSLVPAGHILGSAQAVVEYRGLRMVFTGDYKRRSDPTCRAFEVVDGAHVLISEATFGMPVFRHPDTMGEIDKLLASLKRFPSQTHLVGAYSLGKAQRIIKHLRDAGYDVPIFTHPSMEKINPVYAQHGIDLGVLETLPTDDGAYRAQERFRGRVVVAPSSTFSSPWGNQFPDPMLTFCSGWMGVRKRAIQSGIELPLIISDHADWDELTQTITETAPEELWVTYGKEDALVRWAELQGQKARALRTIGQVEQAA